MTFWASAGSLTAGMAIRFATLVGTSDRLVSAIRHRSKPFSVRRACFCCALVSNA
jgi:hypothetical protein